MSTDFRNHLYQFIVEYLQQQGTSPAFADMTRAMNISPRSKSLITRNLRLLQKEGKIILTKEGRRLAITLTKQHGLPLLGKISAGVPIEAIAHEQYIDANAMLQGSHRFVLQVKGNSMIDEGILDGDLIICEKSIVTEEGKIVVALIDQHSATLKKISYKTKNVITLIPANPTLTPQIYAPERIQIQGIYIGLIRLQG